MWEFVREWVTPQGVIALGVIYTGIQQWRTARRGVAIAAKMDAVAVDVRAVHLATNSIVTAALAAKDEVGVALAAAGVAEGREQMRVEAEEKKEKP